MWRFPRELSTADYGTWSGFVLSTNIAVEIRADGVSDHER